MIAARAAAGEAAARAKKPLRGLLAAAGTVALAAGCAAMRPPTAPGAFVDDAAITSQLQTRLAEERHLDASAIRVETVHGEVMLSGHARTPAEKATAESLAVKVPGVRYVRNEIAVRP